MSNEDQSEIQKLQLENSRLQLKIRAQEGVYQKLIREKELALQAYEETETRLRFDCTFSSYDFVFGPAAS